MSFKIPADKETFTKFPLEQHQQRTSIHTKCFQVRPTMLASQISIEKHNFADKGKPSSLLRSTAGDGRHKYSIIWLFRPHAGSSTCGFGWNIFCLPRRIAKYFMIIKEPFRLENKFSWTWSVSPRSINKAGPEKNHFWRAVSWINCQRSWFAFQACEIFIPELLNSKQ